MKVSLRFLLLIAILLTALTILQSVVGLSAPLPDRQAPTDLDLADFDVTSIASSPQGTGRDFSHGTIQRFRLQPEAGGLPLVLTLMPVRSRNDEALQMALLSEIEPGFTLRSRRLVTVGAGNRDAPARLTDEVALGVGPKSLPQAVSRLQTCVTPTGVAAVTSRSIHQELKANRESALARAGFQTQAARFLGLRPNSHWECLAVQLEAKAGHGAQEALLQAWSSLKPRLLDGSKN